MPINARDLMSPDIASVTPDTPLRDVARALLTHHISAVPVIDATGQLIGMVSEGDLVGRKKTERETRSEWWLQRLAEGEPLNTDFLQHLQSPLAVAREVMSSPVLTLSEETPTDEIASLMAVHNVKRLPVVRDGRVVGIVRRSDLLRMMSGGTLAPVPGPVSARGRPAVSETDLDYEIHPVRSGVENPTPAQTDISADDFRHLVADHHTALDRERGRHHEEIKALRRNELRKLIDTHISDAGWNGLIHLAHKAAERGESEFTLLRFPSQLCSDGGRAINAPDPEWPRTLRGEAAEVYLRWERELRPRGFHLTARVMDFPEGVPGDVGLFLSWDA